LQHTYNCDRLSTKSTEESYKNELQLQKLHSNIWYKSHECNKKEGQHRKAMSNTTHDSDDVAIVSMEINTLMN